MTQTHKPKPSSYCTAKSALKMSLTEKVIRSIVGLYDEGYRSVTHPLLKQLILDYSKAFRDDSIDSQVKTVDTYIYQMSGRGGNRVSGQIRDYADLLVVENDDSLTINDVAVARWMMSQLDDE